MALKLNLVNSYYLVLIHRPIIQKSFDLFRDIIMALRRNLSRVRVAHELIDHSSDSLCNCSDHALELLDNAGDDGGRALEVAGSSTQAVLGLATKDCDRVVRCLGVGDAGLVGGVTFAVAAVGTGAHSRAALFADLDVWSHSAGYLWEQQGYCLLHRVT